MKNVDRDSEQEQPHDQAADFKLAGIKTHAVLAVAMAVKSNQWAYVSFLKLDPHSLK